MYLLEEENKIGSKKKIVNLRKKKATLFSIPLMGYNLFVSHNLKKSFTSYNNVEFYFCEWEDGGEWNYLIDSFGLTNYWSNLFNIILKLIFYFGLAFL